jgi:hypothetical protein
MNIIIIFNDEDRRLTHWLYSEEVPQGTEAAEFFNWRERVLGF